MRLHETADGLIQYGLRKEVNERIAYLQKAMAEVRNPDHRRALTDLLMEQERLKMMVSIDQPYAAAMVEPSAISATPAWPDTTLVFLAFGVAGAFLGFIVFSIAQAFSQTTDARGMVRRQALQNWIRRDSENNNQRPLTGRKAKKKADGFSSKDAAE